MKKIKELIKEILHCFLSNKGGYTDLKVLFGQAKGIILRLDLRREGSYWLGNYDEWIFERINFSDYIKPGMVVLMWAIIRLFFVSVLEIAAIFILLKLLLKPIID